MVFPAIASNTDVYEIMERSDDNSLASKHVNIDEALSAPLPDDSTVNNRRDNLKTLNASTNKLLNAISSKNNDIL